MRTATFFLSILALFTFSSASAQTEAVPKSDGEELVSGSAVVADVNIYDIDLTKDEAGEVAGSFTITAGMGQQNNIAYGVMAVNEKGELVYANKSGVIPTLKQGQTEKRSFSASLPANLSGNLSVVLLAENETGLLLSYRELTKREFSPTASDLSCARATEDLATVTCVNKTATKLAVTYSKSMLGEKSTSEGRVVKANESVSLTPLTKPGRYYVFVSNENNEQIVTQLSAEGAYGEIRNVAIYQKDDSTNEAVIPIYGSKLNGSTLELKLTNSDGMVCDEQAQTMTRPVFTFTINPVCAEGTVLATLKNEAGEVLDTKSQPFSIMVVEPTAPTEVADQTSIPTTDAEPTTKNNSVIVVLVVTIGLLLLIFFSLKKKNVPPPLVLLFFVVGFSLLPLGRAEAVSLFDSRYSQDRGDFAWLMSVTIDFGTTGPFYPGQVTTLTAGGFVQSDNGASPGAIGNGSALYSPKSDMDPNFSFDGAPAGYGNAIASINNVPADKDTHHFSGSIPFTVPSGMSVGDHFLTFVKAQVSGGCYKNPGPYGENCVDISPSATLPFKVANKPACAPTGATYLWNGVNWDDYGTPNWQPSDVGYSKSNQGPLLSAPTPLTGSVTGVIATAYGYPGKANNLTCGSTPPSVDVHFE